jgi:hypothetical protein
MDLGATAKISSAGAKMIPSIADWVVRRRRQKQDADQVKALFGVDQQRLFNYRVSMDHPLLQHGTPHVDDLAAFAAIAGPTIAHVHANGWDEYPDDVEANLDEGMVLIGSPEAEALTRLVFGYRKLPGSRGVELVEDTIDLPFRWLEDVELVSARCKRFVPGRGITTRPNWPIIDNLGGRPKKLFPALTHDDFLNTDYLLITRVPNFLTSRAQESGRSIVSIAGTHGTATRSVGLLLSNRKLLAEISGRLSPRAEAFQVLIEARNIVHDPSRGSIAKGVVIRDVRSFHRPDRVWSEARSNLHRTYTDWAADVVETERNRVFDGRQSSGD